MILLHHIGEYYRYPNSKKNIKLIGVNGFIYHFENNHWCTDSVFIDLIRVKTGIQNYQNKQTELEF